MSKIITEPYKKLAYRFTPKNLDCGIVSPSGYTSGSDNADGITYDSGNSRGESNYEGFSMISTMIDSIDIDRPISFLSDWRAIGWDEAWDIATEEEKLILIQLISLK